MRSVLSSCKREIGRAREAGAEEDGSARVMWPGGPRLLLWSCLAAALFLIELTGCSPHAKLTPAEAAAATEITNEMNTPSAAIGSSRYRTYRWLTPEEMTVHRLGYDLSMNPQTRQEVEQAVNDQLARLGYRQAAAADFTVAFTDVYIDKGGMPWDTRVEIAKYPEEKFTVAFFDAATGEVLWRGWGKEDLRGGQSDDNQVTLAVSHALQEMPVPLIEP
jgi:hypothetical protein